MDHSARRIHKSCGGKSSGTCSKIMGLYISVSAGRISRGLDCSIAYRMYSLRCTYACQFVLIRVCSDLGYCCLSFIATIVAMNEVARIFLPGEPNRKLERKIGQWRSTELRLNHIREAQRD